MVLRLPRTGGGGGTDTFASADTATVAGTDTFGNAYVIGDPLITFPDGSTMRVTDADTFGFAARLSSVSAGATGQAPGTF